MKRYWLAFIFFLQLTNSGAYEEIIREMRFKTGDLEIEIKYQDPSDVDIRLKDSRVLPFHFSIKNLSNHVVSFRQDSIKLKMVGIPQHLAPVSVDAVVQEIMRTKKSPSLLIMLKIIDAQSSAFQPNTLERTLKRRSFQDGDIMPGEKRKGLVFYMLPEVPVTIEWLTLEVAGHEPQVLEINGYNIIEKSTNGESKITKFWKKYFPDTALPLNKSYAVLIGIGGYKHLKALSAPAKDVDKMKNFLKEEGFDEIIDMSDTNVTLSRLRDLRGYFHDKIQEPDRFIFYYSGLGVSSAVDRKTKGYLPLVDEQLGNYDNSISLDDLFSWIETLKARHLLVILDCSFDNLALKGAETKVVSSKLYPRINAEVLTTLATQPARHLLIAGAEGQKAIAGEAWNGSLFTEVLIKGLKNEADLSMDQIITVRELYAWLRPAIVNAARRANKDLSPLLIDLGDAGISKGEFFFVK